MWQVLGSIARRLTLAIPVTMAAGFVYGLIGPVDWLRSLIVPFTFLMVYPMMVTLKLRKVLEGGDAKTQLLAQAINFAVIPFVAYGLGMLFFPGEPFLALSLLLAALLPTSGMTISSTKRRTQSRSAAKSGSVLKSHAMFGLAHCHGELDGIRLLLQRHVGITGSLVLLLGKGVKRLWGQRVQQYDHRLPRYVARAAWGAGAAASPCGGAW